jgi:hypothetical protein
VIDIVVRHREDDRQPIGPPGQLGKVLADFNARHVRLDGLKLTADLGRCQRLKVPSVLLGGSAPHEEQNALLGATEAGLDRLVISPRATRQEARQRQAQQSQAASVQQIAA